jgi:hypothetical protein
VAGANPEKMQRLPNLAGLKQKHGGVPVLALTATATREVTDDIVAQLGMKNPEQVRGSFFRPNLRLSAYRKGGGDGDGEGVRDAGPGGRAAGKKGVRSAIFSLVGARRGQSGIIYAISRKAWVSRSMSRNGSKRITMCDHLLSGRLHYRPCSRSIQTRRAAAGPYRSSPDPAPAGPPSPGPSWPSAPGEKMQQPRQHPRRSSGATPRSPR